MDTGTLGFALAAGLLAAVNPCGFAMLPAYLTLVVTGDGARRTRVALVGRALAASAAMALGFVVVFGAFGLLIAPLAAQVQQYLPVATVVIGLALVCLGGWMLAGRELVLLLPKLGRGAPTARLSSLFGYGLAYAIASLSCTLAPFLAVTSSTFRAGSVLGGVLAYLAYGMGMALVVGVLATAIALVGAEVTSYARRLLPYVNRLGGGLLVLAGLYVGYYGIYELRLDLGTSNPSDPIIAAASTIQQTLTSGVDAIGALPLLLALALITLVAVLLGRWHRKRRVSGRGEPL